MLRDAYLRVNCNLYKISISKEKKTQTEQWEEEEAIALVEERITAEGPLVPSKLARAFHGVTDLFFFFLFGTGFLFFLGIEWD